MKIKSVSDVAVGLHRLYNLSQHPLVFNDLDANNKSFVNELTMQLRAQFNLVLFPLLGGWWGVATQQDIEAEGGVTLLIDEINLALIDNV